MTQPLLPAWASVPRPVIGMLHLLPLPGAPCCQADLPAIRELLLRDADALVAGGVHALMMENFGDTPFYPGRVPASVVASMTVLAADVRRRFDLPLGINVLRNDGRSALGIANAVGAEFIRVNVLCGARVTDQGLIQGIAHKLLRDRVQLGAQHIRILADVDVKHSAPLGAARPIEDEAADLLHRAGADALIVSGGGTGQPASPDDARRAKSVARNAPVFVGSGVTPESIRSFLPHADGFIVGTALKVDGVVGNPVDPLRVKALLQALG
jgi:uncharacterized protein